MKKEIQKLTECVHRQLEYSQYDSTEVRNSTNCYAHGIGGTYPCSEIYRIGAISEKKPIDEKYISENEIKALFLEDMKVIGLKTEEIDVSSKEDCLTKVEMKKLKENQHLVLLFAVYMGNGQLWDFHFWRYDDKGYSEKRRFFKPVFMDEPSRSWVESMKLIGLFRITR